MCTPTRPPKHTTYERQVITMLKKIATLFAAVTVLTSSVLIVESISGSSIISVTAQAADSTISRSELDAIKSRYQRHGYYLKKYYNRNTKTVVKDLQRMLNAEGGYSRIDEDGIFGPATERSVRSFQNRYSLTVDGIAGKNTYAKLFEILYARTETTLEITQQAESDLNINAMISYAQTHWKNYNTNYRNYRSSSSDCCNYASQLLVAGGVPETDRWHGSYNYSSATSSFTYIPDYISYLRSEYGIKYYTKNSNLISAYPSSYDGTYFSVSDIEKGDMITIAVSSRSNGYGKSSYGRDHIMMVTDVNYNTGYVYFTAHTNDRYYSLSSGGYMHVAGIAGLLKTTDIDLYNNGAQTVPVTIIKPEPTPTPEPAPKPQPQQEQIIYGDANKDSKVTITDMSYIIRYINGRISADSIDLKAADVNCDGKVDMNDFNIISQYRVGLITSLPYTN